MNHKLLKVICFLMLSGSNLKAQESFLVFDSIVVLETNHVLTKQGTVGGVLDTITINVLPNQYIKIGNVSLSVRGTSSAASGISSYAIEFYDYDRRIFDLRLDLGKTNLINTTDFGRKFSDVTTYLRNTNNLGVTKNVGFFLSEGTHNVLVKYAGYFGSGQPDREVISRLEIIYLSQE